MSNKNRRRNRQVPLADLAAAIADNAPAEDENRSGVRIEHNGGIFIPHGSDLPSLISTLQAIHNERNSAHERIDVQYMFPVPPWDGARALVKAIKSHLGVVRQEKDDNGQRRQLSIEVEQGKVEQIPWGDFDLPGLAGGSVRMYVDLHEEQKVFGCQFGIERRFESRVQQIASTAYTTAMTDCLHRGRAFTMVFRDGKGQLLDMASPKFFELVHEQPIFTKEIEDSIERNITIPITYASELQKQQFSLKRSALFVGGYGLGKTLLASHLARVATDAGWTFIYVKNAAELPDALRFAIRYQPVMVFAEDIDRVAGIERTDKVNELLNQLDGIDSKSTKLFTILTSNHPERINEAMMRPGRVDLVLRVPPPDSDTVRRMLLQFGGSSIAPNANLVDASSILANESPARVREVLRRSKLEVLRRTGNINDLATDEDMAAIAREVVDERKTISESAATTA